MPQDQDDIKGADAMKQAPTPGPLSASDVKLLVKGDLLRVIDPRAILDLDATETFECVGHPDGFLKLVRRASHFRADRFAFIGRPDADGWIAWSRGKKAPLSGPQIEVRSLWYPDEVIEDCNPDNVHWTDVIAFRLAPTAPVEASGSELWPVGSWLSAALDDPKVCDAMKSDIRDWFDNGGHLRPQPSGETRDIAWKILEEIPAINNLWSQFQGDIQAAIVTALEYYLHPQPIAKEGCVYVEVSGLTGTGKSAVMGEIEIALSALGLKVEHDAAFRSEKNATHADWREALDLYKPTVVLRERNVARPAPVASGGQHRSGEAGQ